MAISASSNPADQLNTKFARSAGASAILAGMAVFCLSAWLLIAMLVSPPDQKGSPYSPLPYFMPVFGRTSLWLAAVLMAGLAGLVISAGVRLARKMVWAFQTLLAVWLAATVAAVCVHAATILYVVRHMDGDLTGGTIALLMLACLIFSGLSLGLLVITVKASESASRMRYFSYVMTSIAAAAAMLIVVNIIAQGDFYRASFQTLGAGRLSDRTVGVLSALDKPVHITCVYIPKEDKKKTMQYSQPVLDLLSEMRQCNPKIETADASSEEEKAALVSRLQQLRADKAKAYVDFLKKFVEQSQKIIPLLDKDKDVWANLGEDAYLSLWPFSIQISENFKDFSAKTRELSDQVSKKIQKSGELPDYSGMARDVGSLVEDMDELMKKISLLIRQMGPLNEQVRANAPKAVEEFDKALAAFGELAGIIGAKDAPVPDDPSAVLEKFSRSAAKAAAVFYAAGDALEDMGGKESAQLLFMANIFRPSLGESMPSPLSYAQLLSNTGGQIDRLFSVGVSNVLKSANTEAQKKVLSEQIRPLVGRLQEELQMIRKQLPDAVRKLSAEIDVKSKSLIEAAAQNQLFQVARQMLTELDKLHKALPELPADTLAKDLEQENIIIVESDDKVKVLPFDKVWPLKVSPWVARLTNVEDADARMFNGDSVISSAVLSMAHKPFANVIMTYFEPPQMFAQGAGIYPVLMSQSLGFVRQQLEDANFSVREWNLIGDFPKLDDDQPKDEKTGGSKPPATGPTTRPSTPKILLVLPPPLSGNDMMSGQQAPRFGPEHLAKIAQEIDSGTPAVVLSGYHMLMPRGFGPAGKEDLYSPPYVLGPYLRQEWGLNVRTEYRLFWGVRDKADPTRFRVTDMMRNCLPLSTFDDHPIGKPLEAQNLLWFNACPIEIANPLPAGVKARGLLTAPADADKYWATTDILQFLPDIDMRRDSFVKPDFAKAQNPDLRPPLAVAAVATRDSDPKRQIHGSRLVVLAMGQSFSDWFLTRSPGSDEDRTIEPPKADADLLTNSLYWAVGRESSIAAGPLQIRPIGKISPASQKVIWATCVILLPLLAVAAGVLVMVLRRR
ncbi:MAG: hypothetical protein HZA50_17000 [Planctomycetes bacterium]|nr:hypothetical protein [Planctomycetota bacterium]